MIGARKPLHAWAALCEVLPIDIKVASQSRAFLLYTKPN
jgi:hypothetical protein